MNRNLPKELHEKLTEKYKYLFSNEYLENNSLKDIFFNIIQDAFVMYTHMAIRYQIITDAIVNIEKTPKIYNKYKNKIDALSIYLNEIVEASNFISYNLYKITKLLKSNTNEWFN